MSACHVASPSPRFPIGMPFVSLTFEMTFISGCFGKKSIP
tara:strand:+ start:1572 stop:1691 length:120 start_codon:yes stop_codon:yes gene_type:complete